ncbi:hypothetical protein VIGAN_05189100, partial [Vigna angularis var. angularis]
FHSQFLTSNGFTIHLGPSSLFSSITAHTTINSFIQSHREAPSSSSGHLHVPFHLVQHTQSQKTHHPLHL